MNIKAKSLAVWGILLSAILLIFPLSVFAQTSVPVISGGLNLFTPPAGDQSVRFLQWIFGVVPGVLNGYGNQLMGLLFSVFNAAGVALLGAFVVIFIYHGVVDLAIKGDFMSGERDKKSVYTIIKIVVATALIVPAKSTGYSMAQSGVMWIVLQGIGLADQVNNKLYTYYAAGGSTFTASTPTFDDVKPLILPMTGILASEVCTYKLQALQDKQNQDMRAVAGNSAVLPTTMTMEEDLSFKTHSDARVATFGPLISTGSATPQGQCGSVSWSVPSENILNARLGLESSASSGAAGSSNSAPQYTVDGFGNYFVDGKKVASNWNEFRQSDYFPLTTAAADKALDAKTIVAYEEAATSQAAMSLLPVARNIVSAGDPSALTNLAPSIGSAIAGAALTYSTIIDPVRQSSGATLSTQMSNMLTDFAQKGWIYTPMMIYTTAFKSAKTINIEDFAPKASPPDVSAGGTAFNALTDTDKESLANMVQNVLTGGYNNYASAYMSSLNASNNGQPVNFADFASTVGTTGTVEAVTGGVLATLGGIRTGVEALDQVTKAPKAVAQGAAKALGGLKSAASYVNKKTNNVGKGLGAKELGDAEKSLEGYDGTLGDLGGLGSAKDMLLKMLNSTIGDVKGLVDDAKRGGFNDQLASLTFKVGPAGPILALLMTSVIGSNINMLQRYVNAVFSGDLTEFPDAMGMAMNMGGKMAESSLKSVFIAGEVTLLLSAAVKFAGAAVKKPTGMIGNLLSKGGTIGSMVGGMVSMVGEGADMVAGLVAQTMQMAVLFFMGFAIIFFIGGLMLYYFLPMVPVLNFLLVVASWFAMVVMSMLGAPIFCINLIRTEGQGMLGKGERYLIDVLRTAIIPSIATIGAVAFIILFNVMFILLSSMIAAFVPIVSQAFPSAYLVSVLLGITLMGFAMLVLWVADSLAKACMPTAVHTIGSMMGEAIQQMHGEAGTQQLGEAVKGAGSQVGGSFGQQGVGGQSLQTFGKAAEGLSGKKEGKGDKGE